MKEMTSTEIRNLWIKYFTTNGHMVLDSASLIPYDDDSLLFTNAGVTPLKKYFDGSVVPENKRIATIQKCIRTNDVDNVGDATHLTFFEMMGNFSIGDYFKKEALAFAFEFLTSEDWCGIPKEKLYVTVYPDDKEAKDRWIELGFIPDHIVPLKENFWEIGVGPCGPDSEIFYDRGDKYDPDGDALVKFKNDIDQYRYVEIWNNVFSQFSSTKGLERKDYPELPHKNIDTGAGLERWCLVFQNKDSIYDTDLFKPLIERIGEIAGHEDDGSAAYKVIADHIRAITMALADGAIFENNGRGYVLRRLLRRSVRFGKKIGITDVFLYKLVDTVVEIMKDSYPELVDAKGNVKTLVLNEEKLFHSTLEAGERRLVELMNESQDKTISGYDVFKLYDTYGFPYELTIEYLEEAGFKTSREEFDKYMEEQKKLSKDSYHQDTYMNKQNEELLNFKKDSEFLYDTYELNGTVIGLFKDGKFVDELTDNGYIILDKTCFYATSGGQVSDRGAMKNDKFKAKVLSVEKAPNGQHLHKVEIVEGSIKVLDHVDMKIIEKERRETACNHSSTHIIQKGLQKVLSSNVHQAGSYVDDNRFRFDFTYTGKITENEILEVEQIANQYVKDQIETDIKEMPIEEAKKLGAMALFTEKYKDVVRVVTIGDSIELCGGTHVKNTKEIKKIAIINLESKGSNLYRIEGVTGDDIENAIKDAIKVYVVEIGKQLNKAKEILKNAQDLGENIEFDIVLDQVPLDSYNAIIYNRNQLDYIQTEVKNLEKKYNEIKASKLTSNLDEYLDRVEEINGVKVLLLETEELDVDSLKAICDGLANKLDNSFIMVANKNKDNVNFVSRSNSDINAGMMVKKASVRSSGNGGGSPTFAQGGGHTTEFISEIFDEIRNEINM